jgi:hypothetical protein
MTSHRLVANERREMDTKRDIAIEYLRINARRLADSRTAQDMVKFSRLRLHYLALAIRYGVGDEHMRIAMGVTREHMRQLVAIVDAIDDQVVSKIENVIFGEGKNV